MALIGRLHPVIIHFPIALVIAAAAAEAAAMATRDSRWNTVAIVNLRAAALCSIAAAVAGWQFASLPEMEPTRLLQWHRWFGTVAALVTVAAAAVTIGFHRSPRRRRWIYRGLLLCAAVLVGGAGHLGGQLVWGAHFLRP